MDRKVLGSGSAGETCPICDNSTEPGYRPFCSRRCADIDLSRWLKGTYAIPGGRAEADEDGDGARAAQTVADDRHASSHEDE